MTKDKNNQIDLEKQKEIDFKAVVQMRKGSLQQESQGYSEEDYWVDDNVEQAVERLQDKYGGEKEEILDKIRAIAKEEEK